MSLFSSLAVSASGMTAQRARAELLVENLANCGNHAHARRRPVSQKRRGVRGRPVGGIVFLRTELRDGCGPFRRGRQ